MQIYTHKNLHREVRINMRFQNVHEKVRLLLRYVYEYHNM